MKNDRDRLDAVIANAVAISTLLGAIVRVAKDQRRLLEAFDEGREMVMADLLTKRTPDTFVAAVEEHLEAFRKAFIVGARPKPKLSPNRKSSR